MGDTHPRLVLPLPALRCQPPYTQPATTIQGQSCRPKHLARLAHLQEPSLCVDDGRGILYRVGPVHTAFLHLLIRACQGCFARPQLSTSRHPERWIFLWPLGAGLHGRLVRTVQYDGHHGGLVPHLRPRSVAHQFTRGRQQGYRPADHLLSLLRLRLGEQHLSHTGLRGAIVPDRSLWTMVRKSIHGRELRLLDRDTDCGTASRYGGRQL